ncbi:MAG: ribosome-associated translation inhibitor RaiA [Burkholderiales bacterium]|jgi:ribosomal subunit interface protein|nr:MAG: ribosome-associated translation inhibitor RaiA [Burkholderiales bacterium]
MKVPLQVTFRDMARSDAVEAEIRRRAEKLEEFSDRIMSCRVTVQMPAAHKQQGKLFSVHLDLKVPGEEIATTRRHEDEDVYVAIRDAFDAVRRRLEDYARRSRGDTKRHEPLLHGRIVRLFGDGHGFIEDVEGNEYYFDDAGVVRPGGWLAVGAAVKFLGEAAGQGLQAKRVTAVR